MTRQRGNETKTTFEMKRDVMIPGTSPHLTADTEKSGADVHVLALAVTDETPPADLWSRIDLQLDAEQASPGISSIRAQDGIWESRPNGVWKKIISARPDGVKMYLLRCAPGACIPGHHHKKFEQVFVLEGEFQMNGVVFGAGDGQTAGANTDHPDIYSQHGCLLLIVA